MNAVKKQSAYNEVAFFLLHRLTAHRHDGLYFSQNRQKTSLIQIDETNNFVFLSKISKLWQRSDT